MSSLERNMARLRSDEQRARPSFTCSIMDLKQGALQFRPPLTEEERDAIGPPPRCRANDATAEPQTAAGEPRGWAGSP
eukprot:9251092-Pyramimonas_sp.AAC.1